MRVLTITVYLGVLVLAVWLSDWPPIVRAMCVVSVGLALAVSIARPLAASLRRARGARWAAAGLCGGCAYPLDRDQTRCPECGWRALRPPGVDRSKLSNIIEISSSGAKDSS